MLIGKKYKLESDSLNIILSKKRKRTRKSDNQSYEDWEIVGYYSSPSSALHAMVDQGIRDTDLVDLIIVSGKIDELHTLIESLPKTYRAITRASKG